MIGKKKPQPPEPKHGTTSESMVAWTCKCGGRWANDRLKGKTDGELIIERDLAFERHVEDMQGGGF